MTSELSKIDLIKLYEKNLNNTNDELRKLKPITINTYVTTVMKIAKDMNKPLESETFKDYKTIKKFIESNNKVLTTIKNKVNAVVMFLKATGNVDISKEYGEWVFALRDKIDDELGQNEKSVKEEKNWLSKESLEKVLSELKQKLLPIDKQPTYEQLLTYQKYFMLSFHLQYPLRNDLAECLIGVDPYSLSFENYIRIRPYLKSARMFLVDYKTSSTYGKIEFEIEGVALDALLQYYVALRKFVGKNGKIPLIVDKDGNPLTSNNYTKHFQAIFKDTGKSVSTTLIRKAIVSSVYDTKKIKELSRIMGHSAEMALNVYAKDL